MNVPSISYLLFLILCRMNSFAISKSSSTHSNFLLQYENSEVLFSFDSTITSPADQSLSDDFYTITSSTIVPNDPITPESKQYGSKFDFCGFLFTFYMVLIIH